MNSWDKLRILINNNNTDNSTRMSQTKSLHEIIDIAEKWNVDPGNMEKPNLSNLYEIIFEAKRAINKEDKNRLSELFQMTTENTNRSLRINLRGSNLEEITVTKVYKEKIPVFHFDLNKEQYLRIEKETEHIYKYHIIE